MLVICVGTILARGRRTVTNIVWTMGELATGDCSAFHRVFSGAPWNMRRLGKTLATLLVELVPEDEWVVLAVVVKFPFATRPWALPGLAALNRPCFHHEAALGETERCVF